MLKTVSSLGNFANVVTLTSTDPSAAAGPLLDLYRDSASPAAADTLGEIEFNGEDSAGNKQAYGVIHASILSPTSTAEQGQLHFETATAGALTEKMIIGTTNLVINEIGAVFNVRIEGDTDANLFCTDATNSRVGIGTVSPTEKLDVVGGNIRIDNGNLVIGTSGKGIDFSATPGTGTSELLADYEEGTWSPVYAMTGTNFAAITMSATYAKYTKVGNLVHVEAYIKTDNLDVTGATGFVKVTGLPFTSASSTLSNIVVSLARNWAVNYPSAAYIGSSDTEIVLEFRALANGATALMNAANMTAGATADQNTMVLTATYFAA